MTIPWDDEVTASMDGPEGREIIVQAPLRIVVPFLAHRSLAERSRIILAFGERTSPPYRYDGGELTELIAALQRQRAIEASKA